MVGRADPLPRVLEHDKRGHLHRVTLSPNSRLAALVGAPALLVNTLHREAIGELSETMVASAHSDNGVIEAIEVPARTFALGLQWTRSCSPAPTTPATASSAASSKPASTGPSP